MKNKEMKDEIQRYKIDVDKILDSIKDTKYDRHFLPRDNEDQDEDENTNASKNNK